MQLLALLLLMTGFNVYAEVFEFGIASDMGKKNQNQRSVFESMVENKIGKLIMAGDNIYQVNSTYESTWSDFTGGNFSFEVTAIGNHNFGYSSEIKFFKMPGEYYVKTFGKRIQFIVLNSDNIENVNEQFKFLENALKQTNRNMMTFLVYHHPTYTISKTHAWTEKKQFQSNMRNVFKNHKDKIRAVIVGHDHLTSVGLFGDIPYLIAGATQEVRNEKATNDTQDGVNVSTAWYFKGNPTWIKMSVNDKSGQIKLQMVDAKEKKSVCDAELTADKKFTLSENCKNPKL